MKKFKLIKEYPGSPNLGTICEERNNKSSFCYYFEGEKNIGITKDQVENQPEYWEEVVDKDYEILISRVVPQEILSVKRLSDGEVFTVGDLITGYSYEDARSIQTIKICRYTGIIKLEQEKGFTSLCAATKAVEKDYEILKYHSIENPSIGRTTCNSKLNDTYNIYSVKRLSDGEVFTVGDLVKTPYTDCTRITGFNTEHSTEYFIEISTEYCTGISTGFTRLLSLEKIKQPIFLTHNGKDIFEGDKVWYVNKENFYYDYIIVSKETKFCSDTRAYFLTRVEAEEYIEKNKPLFTTEDGYSIRHGEGYYFVNTDFNIDVSKANFQAVAMSDEKKYFATSAAAENYVVQKSPSLSIEDFWEFVSWGGSNIAKSKRLKRLVKERLNLK